jgi:hypothetical protein
LTKPRKANVPSIRYQHSERPHLLILGLLYRVGRYGANRNRRGNLGLKKPNFYQSLFAVTIRIRFNNCGGTMRPQLHDKVGWLPGNVYGEHGVAFF